jgi:hypothetical protein
MREPGKPSDAPRGSNEPRKEADVTNMDERELALAMERAMQRAVRKALLVHKKLGNPVATWKDGKVVWIPPDEIEVEDD